jgi:hypothetical protein
LGVACAIFHDVSDVRKFLKKIKLQGSGIWNVAVFSTFTKIY